MAQTMVYTCDLCKCSRSKDDLARIEVSADGIRIKGASSYNPLKIDICKDCLLKKGFLVDVSNDDAEQAEKKNMATLEDKLYEILEDMGVAFCE